MGSAMRFNAATDQLSIAQAPSSSDPWSFCAWVRNIGSSEFATIARLRSSGGTVASFTATSSGVNGPQLATTGGTAGPIVVGPSGSLPVNAWRRVAYVISGTGSNNCTVMWGDDDPTTDLTTIVGSVAVGSPNAFSIAGRGNETSEPWLGDIARARGWTAERSAVDIKAELASELPIITSNIWAAWTLAGLGDLIDISGNGRHLSAGSTPVETVDGPPIAPPPQLKSMMLALM